MLLVLIALCTAVTVKARSEEKAKQELEQMKKYNRQLTDEMKSILNTRKAIKEIENEKAEPDKKVPDNGDAVSRIERLNRLSEHKGNR